MTAHTTGAPSNGTTFSVSSATPGSYDSTGYAALTWTTVGEVSDIPEFGAQRKSASFTSLTSGVAQKFFTSTDPGSLNLQFLRNTDDAGQILLATGSTSTNPISCKLSMSNGDVYYFRALVLNLRTNVGNADGLTMGSCNLDITSTPTGVHIIEVLAA